MGSGSYSDASYITRSTSRGYASTSADALFSNRTIDLKNKPDSFRGATRKHNTQIKQEMLSVGVRECRDSQEHPNSTPIIIALDVTGSMRNTPHEMIKEQLPYIMSKVQQLNVPDPQILFMAVGDHECDCYPIQVGQFESDTDKILDTLESFVLEGGGGGNDGESYCLAWLIAGHHTETDSWYLRQQKGFLFTIGDEPCLKTIDADYLVRGLGYQKGISSLDTTDVLAKAMEQYNVFHIHITNATNRFCKKGWINLLGQNLIECKSDEVGKAIAEVIEKRVSPIETKLEAEPQNTIY